MDLNWRVMAFSIMNLETISSIFEQSKLIRDRVVAIVLHVKHIQSQRISESPWIYRFGKSIPLKTTNGPKTSSFMHNAKLLRNQRIGRYLLRPTSILISISCQWSVSQIYFISYLVMLSSSSLIKMKCIVRHFEKYLLIFAEMSWVVLSFQFCILFIATLISIHQAVLSTRPFR